MCRPILRVLAFAVSLGLAGAAPASAGGTSPLVPVSPPALEMALGSHVLLAWNDLGMHCMNRFHADLSVLPPYNNLHAQLIQRGDAVTLPRLVTAGVDLSYSIPGNTYSVGKTDFWTWAPLLFGVTLPPDVGLTGKGLAGSMDLLAGHFAAEGIPVTPFTDAAPDVEAPYQQALVIARDAGGVELARSRPVIPVSVELSCVSAGCHASEDQLIRSHEPEQGFDPDVRPILCAGCHASPALGTPGIPEARYLSFRLHDQHSFLDETAPGIEGCYKCHPGGVTRCLRGVMSDMPNMICQDCHGDMRQVAASIELGRVPWVEEPACRSCHTSRFGEPAGQLFRHSIGHGGLYCESCHGSTHAEYPSRVAADNANVVSLQGTAGVLRTCVVCHGVTPGGGGPHGFVATGIPEEEVLGGARPLRVSPNPSRGACVIEFTSRGGEGRLLVFDIQGRTVRLLPSPPARPGPVRVAWDGRNQAGSPVSPGIYLARWDEPGWKSAGKILIAR